jgi:hypothetical protein
MAAAEKQLLLVVGSGRSGTSVVSTILHQLGYHIPQPEVQADPTNPRGFGEPKWVVDFHAELLRDARVHTADARPSAWSDTARLGLDDRVRRDLTRWLARQLEHGAVLVKDPRLLWFLPLWDSAGRELGARVDYLTMLRYPAEVVASKDRWYGFTGVTALTAGWINTMLYTERATRGRSRAFVTYDDLLDDWTGALGRIDERIALPPIHQAPTQSLVRASGVIDAGLRRSTASWESLGVPAGLSGLADRVWKELVRLAERDDPGDRDAANALDQLRDEYRAFYGAAESIAESSILAARREGTERAGGRHGGAPDGKASLALRVARLVPERTRRRLSLEQRQALLKRLSH